MAKDDGQEAHENEERKKGHGKENDGTKTRDAAIMLRKRWRQSNRWGSKLSSHRSRDFDFTEKQKTDTSDPKAPEKKRQVLPGVQFCETKTDIDSQLGTLREYKNLFSNKHAYVKASRSTCKRISSQYFETCADIAASFYIYYENTLNVEGVLVLINAALVTLLYIWIGADTDIEFASKLDFSILAFSVVFPLTFLISQAYTRRENALTTLSDFRVILLSMSTAMMTWNFKDSETGGKNGRARLPKGFNEAVRDNSVNLLTQIYEYLSMPTVSHARHHIIRKHRETTRHVHADQNDLLKQIATTFNLFHGLLEVLKSTGLDIGLASRIHQYEFYLQQRFGALRNIKYYRTPQAARSFGRVYIFVLPWFFGPYFVWVAGYQESTTSQCNPAFAVLLAVFTFLVLLGLMNTQRLLEDPFIEDYFGYDSIKLRYEFTVAVQHLQNNYLRSVYNRSSSPFAVPDAEKIMQELSIGFGILDFADQDPHHEDYVESSVGETYSPASEAEE